MAWMNGETNYLPPPIECNLDPYAFCNAECSFCFDKDEKVTMADLTHKKIKDIKVGDEVLGYENKCITKTKVLNVFDNGRMDWLYKITLEDGNSIICTKNHKIWKANRAKWTQAKYLKVGHTVKKILYYSNPKLANLERCRNYKKGYVAGLALGDGCMSVCHSRNRKGGYYEKGHLQFRLVQKDTEAMERFSQYCTDLGIVWNWGIHNSGVYEYKGNSERKYYKAIFINQDASCRILENLMKKDSDAGRVFKIGWIAGIFDAEGSTGAGIRIHQNDGTPISEKIKRIVGSLGYKYKVEKNGIRLFADSYNIINFLLLHNPAIKRKTDKFFIKTDPRSGMEITKIERIRGRRRIFDLETGTHNYFVKGVLVHNCIVQRYLKNHREEIGEMTSLPIDYCVRLIDFLSGWHVSGLCLSGGGDPSLYEGTPKLLTYGKDKGMNVSMFTNGIKLSDELIESMMVCQFVTLSIDASNRQDYKIIKGVDKFDSVVENISRIVDQRIKDKSDSFVVFRMVVLPENYKSIFSACKLAKELGLPAFNVRPVDLERSDIVGHKKLSLDVKYIQNEFAMCHELEDENFKVFTTTHKFDAEFHNKQDFKQCLATPLLIPILTDGNAYICVDRKMEKDYLLGSCFPDPNKILEWWGSDEHRERLKKIIPSVHCKNMRCTFSQYNEQCEAIALDSMFLSFP
jgi:pyruvate-formate lyase-activating enzyme